MPTGRSVVVVRLQEDISPEDLQMWINRLRACVEGSPVSTQAQLTIHVADAADRILDARWNRMAGEPEHTLLCVSEIFNSVRLNDGMIGISHEDGWTLASTPEIEKLKEEIVRLRAQIKATPYGTDPTWPRERNDVS